jgi:hypothetical protein
MKDILKIVNEHFEDLKNESIGLMEENGEEMYKGLITTIKQLQDNKEEIDELISEVVEEYSDDEDYDDDFRVMVVIDSIDKLLMTHYREQFKQNLINLGFKYDGECWNMENKFGGNGLTCYGVVWDYWLDLDTDVRECVSDIFEEIMD